MLFVDAGMDEDVAFRITKSIYDNMDEFRAANALAKQIVPERSKSLRIPLHPGAAKYFGQ
jgi:TRAP-type uncharacterized transport system substrate-binding protein